MQRILLEFRDNIANTKISRLKYRPGKELFIADALSRSATSSAENSEDDFEVHMVDYMPISDLQIEKLKKNEKDTVLK